MPTDSVHPEYSLDLPGGLRFLASPDPNSILLDQFFEGYDRCFVLRDEREELEGFRKCLALNQTHRNAFGRTSCELVAVIVDEEGDPWGGASFLTTTVDPRHRHPPATIALSYVYVEESFRGRSLLRPILAAVKTLGLASVELNATGPSPAIFIEQNDPLRLSAEEYRTDSRHSGLDQVDRLAMSARLGSRLVDFPYVQPALSEAQEADDSLIYAVIDFPGKVIPPRLLRDHLESFFGISVLKGEPERNSGVAAAQVAALSDRIEAVDILPMEPALDLLRAGETAGCRSFRELARRASPA